MTESPHADHPSAANWVAVAVAWLLVGLPLLWGVLVTLEKAAPLFRQGPP